MAQPVSHELLVVAHLLPTMLGFPCCYRTPLRPCRHHYPGGLRGCSFRSLPHPSQPSLKFNQVGVRIALFEACSVFTRVTACSLADLLQETFSVKGFSRFVASASASTATGRSESLPGGSLLSH